MAQPPHDHVCVTELQSEATAAARVAVRLAARKRAGLMELVRPAFRRTGTWLQAGKYVAALMSDLPRRNGRTIARQAGDRSPDRTTRRPRARCAGSRSMAWTRPPPGGGAAVRWRPAPWTRRGRRSTGSPRRE